MWGSPTENCFVKSHSLIEYNEDEVLFNKINDDEKQYNDSDVNENDDLIFKNKSLNEDIILQKDNSMPPVIFIHLF